MRRRRSKQRWKRRSAKQMEIVSHQIRVKSRTGEEVLLMPVGDIQWAGCKKEVALEMLKRHIEWGVEKGAYFLGMGDYIDFMSPSNRSKLAAAGLYDTALRVMDDKASELVEELYEKALKPSKGRWLGLLEGHHYKEYRDGTTSDQQLCKLLGAPHLGSNAYVRLVFSRSTGNHRCPVLIWCHHGVGGATTSGGSINKVEAMVKGFEADIYLIGHDTKKVAAPIDRLEPIFPGHGPARLSHKTRILARTGGFMRTYMVGSKSGNTPRGGYGEQAMYNPSSLGGILVHITPEWIKDESGCEVWHPDFKVTV